MCTNCGTNNCNCQVLTIPTGATGAAGADGMYGGNSAEYIFDTSTVLTPAAGHIRANNANLSAATIISVAYDSVDTIGSAMTVWLGQIYGSTNANKATVRLFSKDDSSKFIEFTVTSGFSGVGTELTGTTTAVSSNSPFANGESIVISYSIAGDAGTNGTNGADGTTVLYNNNVTALSGDTASAWVTQLNKSYTILANELNANGDMVLISSQAYNSDVNYATDGEINSFRVMITNNAVVSSQSITFSSHLEQARIDIALNRISNTTARLIVTLSIGGSVVYIGQADMAAIDFTLTTLVEAQANTTIADVGVLNFIVTKYNI